MLLKHFYPVESYKLFQLSFFYCQLGINIKDLCSRIAENVGAALVTAHG